MTTILPGTDLPASWTSRAVVVVFWRALLPSLSINHVTLTLDVCWIYFAPRGWHMTGWSVNVVVMRLSHFLWCGTLYWMVYSGCEPIVVAWWKLFLFVTHCDILICSLIFFHIYSFGGEPFSPTWLALLFKTWVDHEINEYFYSGLIKSDSKGITNSNKCCSVFILSIHQKTEQIFPSWIVIMF